MGKGRRTPWIYYSGLKIVGRGEKISGIHPSLGFCVSFLLEIMGISIIIDWLIYAQKPKRKKMNKELILRHNTIYKKKETKSVTRLLLENHYLDVYKKRSEPSPRRKKKRPRWLIHRIYLYWPSLKFVKDKLPCISSLSRNHKKTERKDTAIIFFSPFSCDLPWNNSHPSLSFFF